MRNNRKKLRNSPDLHTIRMADLLPEIHIQQNILPSKQALKNIKSLCETTSTQKLREQKTVGRVKLQPADL